MDETDEETGVSSILYDSMKKQFRSALEDKLRKDISIPEEEIQRQLTELDNYLVNFDNQLKSNNDGTHSVDYTAATMSLSEVASEKYGLLLNRRCSITMSTFQNEYYMLRQSTYDYMISQLMDKEEIERILKDCDDRFDELMKDVSKNYQHDPLLGITKSQNRLLDIFKENNAEVALVAGINKLSDFANRYTFEFNPEATEEGYYDVLVNKLHPGQLIDTNTMNNVFICRDRQKNTTPPFDPTMVETFVIQPYLGDWYADPYSNVYGMDIDWRIYPKSYESDAEMLPKVTAHVYGENKQIAEGTYDPEAKFNDILQQSDVKFTRYYLRAHCDFEKETLVDTYFNPTQKNNHVYFDWQGGSKNKDNKYECFFDGMKDGEFTGTLTSQSLANSGLRISSNGVSYESLNDVLDRVALDNQDPEHARPESQLSLADKFVKYCILKSETTSEDGPNDGDHKVHHNFFYQYGNSVYGDSAIVKDPDYSENERRSDGFLVSEKFFEVANQKFNETYSFFKKYRDNEFYEIKANCNELEAGFVSTSCMTAVQIAKNVLKMFFAGIAGKLIAAYTIALLTSNAVVLGIIWPVYLDELIYPIDDFVDNVDKLKSSKSFDAMQTRLATDSKWFAILQKGKKPGDYDQKKLDFQRANFVTESRPLFQYYSTAMDQQDFLQFKSDSSILHCDPKTFKKEFGGWMYTGTQYIACYGYSLIRFLLNQLLLPEVPSSWSLFIAEFTIETLLGMNLTKVLSETAFSYDYEDTE